MERMKYILFSGKNMKIKYYMQAYQRLAVPSTLKQQRLPHLLAEAAKRPDYDEMCARRDYYCRLLPDTPIGPDATRIQDIKIRGQKVYPLDTLRVATYFNQKLPLRLLTGDITYVPQYPSVVKSRPIMPDNANANSILLCLNKVRHFITPHDKLSYNQKMDIALFRGRPGNNPKRYDLLTKFHGHPYVDVGDVSRHPSKPEWYRPKMTIGEQLQYKFILSIEGNDVASNLKWIMASNSVAVMPHPTMETWFMEGTLIPGYHYIEVKDDFSDLIDKLQYYIAHPEEVEQIIGHAHEYMSQFADSHREFLISLMTLDKYFKNIRP